MSNEQIIVMDFGGQYSELIARRVRECGVSSVIEPGNTPIELIRELAPIGIVLTGGPQSVYEDGSQTCTPELFELGIPVLGICYGMHVMTSVLGGSVVRAERGEYGSIQVKLNGLSELFYGLNGEIDALMSHRDEVQRLPPKFQMCAYTDVCAFAAMEDGSRKLYGVQFHPEVESTQLGIEIIRNFLFRVCGATGDYTISDYESRMITRIREQVGDGRVILALSGGVDSSVCAALLSKAIPGRLHCVFVDHGLMRKNEGDEVEAAFSGLELDFIRVNAADRFLEKLSGVTEPEMKRKIIGEEFIRVFEEEARKLGDIKFLAQGTIYPDVIESGATAGAATIKSHHNVGGLPENMEFEGIVEPLRGLFKSEVRLLGRNLGISEKLTERQPFPGPGLAIRCIGEVTREKLDILREADAIFRDEVAKSGIRADQYFAVLTDTQTVGVAGDSRSYGYAVALRAVKTTDFMTCEYVPLPHELLDSAAKRIVGECPDVSRVVYDITGKPPATIEWE